MQAGFQAFLVKIAEMLPRASFEGFSLITQQAWSPVFHQNLGNEQVLKPWVGIGWGDSSIPTDSLAKNNRSIALPKAPKLSFIGSISILLEKSPDSLAYPDLLSKSEFGIADQEQIVKGLRKKAQAMGFDLVATPSTQIVS